MENSQQTPLAKEIIKIINEKEGKEITFYEFMNLALYAPELGYYTKDKTKIGKQADFYTSSSVGPVFGYTIAKNFVELLPYTSDDKYYIIEIGGGNGRFARDVLDHLKDQYPAIYSNLQYFMLEASPYHKALQIDYVKEHLNHLSWISNLKELPQPYNGIVFSNELIDSFPVHKVKKENGTLKEVYVSWDDQKQEFKESLNDLSNPMLQQYFDEQNITLKEGQTAEVNLNAIDWILSIGETLNKGYVLTIDYGYDAEELYASHRHEGSLMCYYQHLANDKPYQNIGDQDITTHVNFTTLLKYGEKVGLYDIWFTTQNYFLLNNGILDFLEEIDLEESGKRDIFTDEALKRNRAIRHLITPGEMGETFKVLLQQKNIGHQEYQFLKNLWQQQ